MRCVFKFLMLPVIFILSVMKLFLEGATKVYCLVAGVAINLLVIFSVLAIITQQWFALVVFGVIFVFYIGGSVCYWTYRFISREFERQNILKIRTDYDLVCPFVKLKVLYVWSDKLFYLFNCFYSVLSFRYGFCCKSIQ